MSDGTTDDKAGGADLVRVERRGSGVWVGLDRPEKRNALDRAMVDALHAALTEAAAGPPAVLVLHSTTPGTFVAGADIAELLERRADDALAGINSTLFDRLEAHPWPTIAAVDGPALGGGCELALACDLRVATAAARFAQPEASLGILAGAGANWRLAELVGLGQARRLLYLGDSLDAEAALAAGLVDRLAGDGGLEDSVEELVATMARRSWSALRLTKLALRQHRPATTGFDAVAQALLFEGEDKVERMQRFLSRRRSG